MAKINEPIATKKMVLFSIKQKNNIKQLYSSPVYFI